VLAGEVVHASEGQSSASQPMGASIVSSARQAKPALRRWLEAVV
jgi:hypothetical protein